MEIRDFTREEIPKAIAKWIRSLNLPLPLNYAAKSIAKQIDEGAWLTHFQEAEDSWK